jgi:hypothetical protein
MFINNLPNKADATVTVVLTETMKPYINSPLLTRTFDFGGGGNYSLEEAISIEGFLGFVHETEQGAMIHNSAVHRDNKGLPRPVVAVCFIKPKE